MKTSERSQDLPPCIWCGGSNIKEITAAVKRSDERWFNCSDCRRVFCVRIDAARGDSVQAPRAHHPHSTTIRISKVPPSAFLEGVDLRPYDFRVSRCYDVPRSVAEVLIDWGYAKPHVPR